MTTKPMTLSNTVERRGASVQADRVSLAFFNTHATATHYIKDGKGVATANGIPVYPLQSVSLNLIEDGETVKDEWYIISDTNLATVVIFEGYKQK